MAESLVDCQDLRWLEPGENPFGVRLLDCRKSAAGTQSWFGSEEAALARAKKLLSDGSEFRFTSPADAIVALCRLEYPWAGDDPIPEGPLFKPKNMEDNWFIYHFNGEMIFTHCEQPREDYRAHIRRERDKVVVDRLTFDDRYSQHDPAYCLRVFDYLIKSHLYSKAFPHPLPPKFKDEDDEFLVEFSFFEYGRRGLFATLDETLHLPWLDVDARLLIARKPSPV